MQNLQCPNCQKHLTENQVKLKLTKDKKAYKARCGLCHHAWREPCRYDPSIGDGLGVPHTDYCKSVGVVHDGPCPTPPSS